MQKEKKTFLLTEAKKAKIPRKIGVNPRLLSDLKLVPPKGRNIILIDKMSRGQRTLFTLKHFVSD